MSEAGYRTIELDLESGGKYRATAQDGEVFLPDGNFEKRTGKPTGVWAYNMTCIECGHTRAFQKDEIQDRIYMRCEQCKTGTYTYACYIDKAGGYFGQKHPKLKREEFDALDRKRARETPHLDKRQQRIARILFGKFMGVLTPEQADKELIKLGAKSTWAAKEQATDDTNKTVLHTLGEELGERI